MRIGKDEPPSILMLSWNRREYFERTIAHLLADPSDYRLFLWDNGSRDGVADLVRDLDDPRIERRVLNAGNVGQAQPWHWFLENCRSGIAGKIDDDVLGEPGWMARFAGMLAAEPRFGTLGAWVYLREEWDAATARHKMRRVGEFDIFENPWVPGGIFLGRTATLRRFSPRKPDQWGVPLNQPAMQRRGFINGYPLPISFAEHLDDPRSPHCRMNRPGGWDEFAAYSARMRRFASPEDYGRWIAADARSVLETPVDELLRRMTPSATSRVRSGLRRLLRRTGWRRGRSG